jgi:N-acetylglucosamine-6-phosphate deacetylase
MSAPHAVAAGHVFDGTDVHRNAAVVIDDAAIVDVVPRADLPFVMAVRDVGDAVWLAPGFIDIQVNGGGDVLFNDTPTAEAMSAIAAAHRQFGTTSLLPTLISDTPSRMRHALAASGTAVARDPGVLGVHLEGPFLSRERPGVHDVRVIRRPTEQDATLLMALRPGVTLVTLAPEQMPPGFIARLVAAGIRVSLGHSMATYAETRAAMAEGLSGFTHLFNAMRPLGSREPGPIAAALEAPDAWFGIIVDGVHVDPVMLRLALRGRGRAILVTDAMPPVGGTRSTFTLYGEEMRVHDGYCTRADGTLAGAFLDMATAVRNTVQMLDVPLPQALCMASLYPAQFIGVDDRLGRLAPGYRADMVAFDPSEIAVLETWVAGKPSHAE